MVRRDTMPRSRQFLLAAASGIMLVFAFPPFDFVPAAFVALVPLFHAIRRGRRGGLWSGFAPGFVAGIAFFLPLLYWLVFLSSAQMDNPVVMSGPLMLLVMLQAFYWGLFSACATFVDARTRFPAVLALPILWVAFEQLRSLGVLGLTWGAVGYSAVTVPSAMQFATFTGMFGISFWIVMSNATLLALFTSKGRRVGRALALAVIVVAPFVHGNLVMGEGASGETIRVAVIQPNIAGEIKWDARFKSESFDALTELSREAAKQKPDLIVWPETAAPSYLRSERDDLALVAAVARDAGAPVLTGCPDIARESDAAGEYRPLNSVLLVGADGTVGPSYNKIRLVPFGEVIPFETVVPFLRRVDFGEADFLPGSERTVFELPGVKVATLICFESAFPRLAREFVAAGAELLVNVTNDVWYGRTSMPFQHASMAIMRSVENRRSLARSANSGVSMLVDPFGRVIAETSIFERTYLVGELPVATETTFYARHGDLFPWAAVLAGALMVAVSAWSGRRLGRSGRVRLSD